ncbi:MAG TPA: hypothetical protein VEM95_02785 [Thermoplasmata archaeon]|nr:hypothetical protein [Thermoplasmata archaeon]
MSALSTPFTGPTTVSPAPACTISPGATKVTPCVVVPAITRSAFAANASAFPRPFCSVTNRLRRQNARSASTARSVSYAFVVMNTTSGASAGASIRAVGHAIRFVTPEIRRPRRFTASTWGLRATIVTSFSMERRPPRRLPIAPAPNTSVFTTSGTPSREIILPLAPRKCSPIHAEI